MSKHDNETAVSLYGLDWDTEFFGVSCAKAVIYKPLTLTEWKELKTKFKEYQFVSIENRNSEPINAQLIGKENSIFLADINMQFIKKLEGQSKMPKNITIHQALERNDRIIRLADFKFSKFTEDPELAKRGGNQVYRQWLINSFNKSDMCYALSKDLYGDITGFLLYSYLENSCIIELIGVSETVKNVGIGRSLFEAVEYEANQRDYREIKVGTQVRNIGAINFYHKVGCKQVGCHQVYHYWNL